MNGLDPATRLQVYVRNELERFERLDFFGQLAAESQSHIDFVKALARVLDERDKLLKYTKLVVKRHEKFDFDLNVNAIRDYLKNDLGIVD